MKKSLTSFADDGSLNTVVNNMLTGNSEISLSGTVTWSAFGVIGYENTAAAPTFVNQNVIPFNLTLRNLAFYAKAPIGAGKTAIVTIYKSEDAGATWQATTLTATIVEGDQYQIDTTHVVSFNQGDLVAIGYISTGGAISSSFSTSVKETAA